MIAAVKVAALKHAGAHSLLAFEAVFQKELGQTEIPVLTIQKQLVLLFQQLLLLANIVAVVEQVHALWGKKANFV